MIFLRSWLENYVALGGLTNAELEEKITNGSSEVEGVTMLKDYFDAKVLVGRIENVRKHENADRLKVFNVYLGEFGTRQIVSAAPNVKEGLIVPVAIEGARLPYVTIAQRAMRGVESQGMCLGKSELMLETKPSEGLWELETELSQLIPNRYSTIDDVFGQSICNVFPNSFPEESLFDIKVLPNRMTEIGHHLGMAREISLILGDRVNIKDSLKNATDRSIVSKNLHEYISKTPQSRLTLELRDTVNYVKSFALTEVILKEEYYLPKEYQKAMFLTGRNLVGSIADLTNYFLADFGQPTHVFASEKVSSSNQTLNWIVDKTTTPREFNGLGNLKETVLPAGIPILYDSLAPENIYALPAISGSDSTKADYNGKSFLFEVANFDSDDVAQASFDLKYRSDGSRMWAGGVNQALSAYTLVRLFEESEHTGDFEIALCGHYDGARQTTLHSPQDISDILDTYCQSRNMITIDWNYLSRRLDGDSSSSWRMILESKLTQVGELVGDVFFPDVFWSNIRTQNDVLEEMIRLIDYDQLAQHTISGGTLSQTDATYESLLALKKRVAHFGFQEVITRPFVGEADLESNDTNAVIRVLKPYNSLMPFVRDNHTSSLMMSISENIQRGEKDPLVFELGLVYRRDNNTVQAPRKLTLAGVSGDPYRFTSVVQDVNKHFELSANSSWKKGSDTGSNLETNIWELNNQDSVIARIFEVSNATKKQYNIPLNKKLFVAEVNLDKDLSQFSYSSYYDESPYPVVRRTYSYLLDSTIQFAAVRERIETIQVDSNSRILVRPIERINSEEGKDILNLDVVYINYDKTLEGEEISQYESNILESLQKLGNIVLR